MEDGSLSFLSIKLLMPSVLFQEFVCRLVYTVLLNEEINLAACRLPFYACFVSKQ